jgi:hypothetical protein
LAAGLDKQSCDRASGLFRRHRDSDGSRGRSDKGPQRARVDALDLQDHRSVSEFVQLELPGGHWVVGRRRGPEQRPHLGSSEPAHAGDIRISAQRHELKVVCFEGELGN